ncbi:LytTR family DNA-binding domain-containing protein [Terrimonas sp. NA20]|uniref:LytTR family DNA-binding domain-containing protein n=1 Tax=Terrimonas ginsenosidimutans TaxID=2908004 RepID=A0ABS9KTX4_9BACT|nr:LytTR family DNA-binding domain-containing protein [Terrimonas ginsenosidimutans]MCG2615761.1 LytTR family DNA-binding domain-containing protein [Terrimonas ginsenosidimutans]
MIKAIAIDDEPIALEVIRQHCRSIPFIQLEQCFTDPDAAMSWLNDNKVDLLFLDIRMPDISGIDFLKQLNPAPPTIFTTAHSEHAVQSFELDALDYLLKPFSTERFLKACLKAKDWLELRSAAKRDAFLFIKTGYEQVKVQLNEIIYIQSAGNYVQFVLQGQKKLLSRSTMAETMAMLPPEDFVRIHRQYIAGKQHISRIEKNTVYCEEMALPVGAGYGFNL